MASYNYHYRVKANMVFNSSMVGNAPTAPELARFRMLLWSGQDDEGWCVYRRDPQTGEVVRIDFIPPTRCW